MRLLVTGGAGFVGSSLARLFRTRESWEVVALDNLKRRGSELNLPAFRELGVEFARGDVRSPADLDRLPGSFDLMIDASAEASVHAGAGGEPEYLLQTNVDGTINCLEFARRRGVPMVFLSTSRVYSIDALLSIPLEEADTRLRPAPGAAAVPGFSAEGVSEDFSTAGFRSLYGGTKLCSEILIQEYCRAYGLRAVVDRCGVVAGPRQWGRPDQGVFALWVARHHFGRGLAYTGFGGSGKQVRDLLHPEDLFELVRLQAARRDELRGEVFNVGGGAGNAVSLLELTALCREATGRSVPIASRPETSPVDVPYYVSDARRARAAFGWTPRKTARDIVWDIARWLRDEEELVGPAFLEGGA